MRYYPVTVWVEDYETVDTEMICKELGEGWYVDDGGYSLNCDIPTLSEDDTTPIMSNKDIEEIVGEYSTDFSVMNYGLWEDGMEFVA